MAGDVTTRNVVTVTVDTSLPAMLRLCKTSGLGSKIGEKAVVGARRKTLSHRVLHSFGLASCGFHFSAGEYWRGPVLEHQRHFGGNVRHNQFRACEYNAYYSPASERRSLNVLFISACSFSAAALTGWPAQLASKCRGSLSAVADCLYGGVYKREAVMKDLLAVVTPVPDDSVGCAADYALALASSMGAHVTFLIAEIEPDIFASMAEPDNMLSCSEITDVPTKAVRVARTIELVQAAAKLKNVSCTVLEGFSPSLRDLLIGQAQVHDCTVLDARGPLRHPRQGLIEGVLFASGRPIILVPPTAFPLVEETVLVAWDATRSAVRALHDALPLLIRAREVFVISVTGDKEFSAVELGSHICRYLSRWNIRSRFELVERGSGSVGGVLFDYAARIKANLVVMGGFGHPREREFLFGSATRDVFQSGFSTAVLLSH